MLNNTFLSLSSAVFELCSRCKLQAKEPGVGSKFRAGSLSTEPELGPPGSAPAERLLGPPGPGRATAERLLGPPGPGRAPASRYLGLQAQAGLQQSGNLGLQAQARLQQSGYVGISMAAILCSVLKKEGRARCSASRFCAIR